MRMTDVEPWHERTDTIITQLASSLARYYHQHVETEDVWAYLWEWALEHSTKIQELLEENNVKAVTFYLRTAGRVWCMRERAKRGGYSWKDYAFYTVPQLKVLLESVFDYEDWQPTGLGPNQGMPRAKADPSHGGDFVTSLADITAVLPGLEERHYNLIVWKYKYFYTDEMIAEEFQCTEDAARKRVDRAVEALQKALGGPDPFKEYEGTRRVVSNATARAQTSQQWEGE